MKDLFVVLRLDPWAQDALDDDALVDMIVVKSVHKSEAEAQQQVDRLNLLGRSHYFWRHGKLLDKVPPSQPPPRRSEPPPFVGGYWLVGDAEANEGRSLDEQIESLKGKGDWLLISWISSSSRFQIPSAVWTRLAQWSEVTFSLSLGLVEDRASRCEGVPSDISTYIEIVCDTLGVNIRASSFEAAIYGLTTTLRARDNQARPHTLYLGRFASNGQVNLHFPRELILLLAEHEVSIQGGAIVECHKLREEALLG